MHAEALRDEGEGAEDGARGGGGVRLAGGLRGGGVGDGDGGEVLIVREAIVGKLINEQLRDAAAVGVVLVHARGLREGSLKALVASGPDRRLRSLRRALGGSRSSSGGIGEGLLPIVLVEESAAELPHIARVHVPDVIVSAALLSGGAFLALLASAEGALAGAALTTLLTTHYCVC